MHCHPITTSCLSEGSVHSQAGRFDCKAENTCMMPDRTQWGRSNSPKRRWVKINDISRKQCDAVPQVFLFSWHNSWHILFISFKSFFFSKNKKEKETENERVPTGCCKRLHTKKGTFTKCQELTNLTSPAPTWGSSVPAPRQSQYAHPERSQHSPGRCATGGQLGGWCGRGEGAEEWAWVWHCHPTGSGNLIDMPEMGTRRGRLKKK